MTEDEIRDYVDQHLQTAFFSPSIFDFLPTDIRKEYGIQMGSYRGRADLVLLVDDKPLVIVECKSQGVMAQGIDQLKSYLCASPAWLGIFANSTNPDHWTYLEKIGYNEFVKIDRDTFKVRLWEVYDEQQEIEQSIKARTERHFNAIANERAKQRVTPSAIQARTKEMIEAEARNHITNSAIQARRKEITEREARERVTNSAIEVRTKVLIEREAKKRVTESAIQGAVANKQEATIVSQQREINTLRDQRSNARFFAISGWGFFLCAILLSVIISLRLF
jgi:hypothetical protein